MVGTRRATNTKIQQAEELFRRGESNAEVARLLGCSTRTVRTYAAALRKVGALSRRIHKGGRPRKLDPRTMRVVVKEALEGESLNQQDMVHYLGDFHNIRVSKTTVKRALRRHNVLSCKKRRRALLTQRHRDLRLAFAREHIHWTSEQWSKVLWSDESRRNLWGCDGSREVFRRRGAALRERDVTPTVKHGGGGIMIWGCFTSKGVGRLTRLVGSVNTDKYLRICGPLIMFSIAEAGLSFEEATFQQDNASCHVSATSRAWFEEGGIKLMKWPPQSPGLNPIENLWADLKKRVYTHPRAPNLEALWEIIEGEWDSTPPDLCQRLVDSMPRRLMAVINAKGGYTKY